MGAIGDPREACGSGVEAGDRSLEARLGLGVAATTVVLAVTPAAGAIGRGSHARPAPPPPPVGGRAVPRPRRTDPYDQVDYEAWLAHVFDRPARQPAWFFETGSRPPRLPPAESAEHVTRMLLRSGVDLERYSDAQVARGLRYVFDASCSNLAHSLRDGPIALEAKLGVLGAIGALYSECFARRCAPVLGHLDERPTSKLNGVCYMLWDVTPLSWWRSPRTRKPAYDAIFDVLEGALALPHAACVESALHGVGHLALELPRRAAAVVDRFLARSSGVRPELVRYAEAARRGGVA